MRLESQVYIRDIPYKLFYRTTDTEELLYVISIDPSALYEMRIDNPSQLLLERKYTSYSKDLNIFTS